MEKNSKRYIFVDFEMQPIDHKEHPDEWSIARHEIIEFGAVMLDEELKETGSFQRYVKPQYSTEIHETVRAMTGITEEMLSDADTFESVFDVFLDWCASEGDYLIYAWSGADRGQLTHEIELKRIAADGRMEYMLSHWYDYQRIFTRAIGRSLAVSLDRAVEACGMEFEGQMHDALWDARNTARLFRLTSDRKEFRKHASRVKHALDSKEHFTASLGDLVDMSGFKLPKD